MPHQQVWNIRPGEVRTLTVSFSGKLPSGVNISSATVAAINAFTDASASAILASGPTASVTSTTTSAVVSNCTLDQRYEVTFTATLSDATPSIIKETVIVNCTDLI